MAENTEITVSCHCGAATHTFTVPLSSLPLATHLCSCDISRRISGTLLTSYINITFGANAPKPETSVLTGYQSSGILTRHFCSTCGTQMYLEYNHDGHFEAATGTLQVDSTDEIIEFKDLMWIEDTKDGGASQFLTHISGNEMKRWPQESGQSDEIAYEWKHQSIKNNEGDKSKLVRAHCHCNGVEFYICPPTAASKTAESSYPDLLIPYHSGSSDNPKNHPWWLPRSDGYLAGTCACASCRRMSGFDITCWAFIPAANITLDAEGTRPFKRNPYWGTMKTYQSSKGVTRTFCGRCGANVFWDGRESLIDVAVGLLDAESGARAEEILAWWPGRVSFEEDALNKGLIKGLEEGLKTWAKKNEGSEAVAVWQKPDD